MVVQFLLLRNEKTPPKHTPFFQQAQQIESIINSIRGTTSRLAHTSNLNRPKQKH